MLHLPPTRHRELVACAIQLPLRRPRCRYEGSQTRKLRLIPVRKATGRKSQYKSNTTYSVYVEDWVDSAVFIVVGDAAAHDDPRQCKRSEFHVNAVLDHVVEVVDIAPLRRLRDPRCFWIAV